MSTADCPHDSYRARTIDGRYALRCDACGEERHVEPNGSLPERWYPSQRLGGTLRNGREGCGDPSEVGPKQAGYLPPWPGSERLKWTQVAGGA